MKATALVAFGTFGALIAGAAGLAGTACSSADTTTTIDDAGLATSASGSDSAFFATPDSGTCSAIDNAAKAIPFTFSATLAPAPAGGTIADGTYFLTNATEYTMLDAGVTAAELGTIQITLRVANGVAQTVETTSLNMTTTRAAATYTTSGSAVDLNDTRPDTKVKTEA